MENVRGRKGSGQDQLSRQMIFEEFQPSNDWTTDSTGYVLLVDLPGFKKEEVKLQVNNSGRITVSGESSAGENKRRRFSQNFKVPNDTDIEKISGKFENGLLFVIVPKKQPESKEKDGNGGKKDSNEGEKPNNKALGPTKNEHEKTTWALDARAGEGKEKGLRDEMKGGIAESRGETSNVEEERERLDEEALESNLLQIVLKKITNNKGIILMAVIGFSLGFYVSHKVRA